MVCASLPARAVEESADSAEVTLDGANVLSPFVWIAEVVRPMAAVVVGVPVFLGALQNAFKRIENREERV